MKKYFVKVQNKDTKEIIRIYSTLPWIPNGLFEGLRFMENFRVIGTGSCYKTK